MFNISPVNESLKNVSEFAGSIPSKAEGIALCSAFILSSVFIIAGNFLTLVLFAVSKALRKKSFFLITNMAFADLMLGAFTMPSYIYSVGVFFQLWTAKYDHLTFGIFFTGFDTMFMLGSYLSAAFMSCERFHAVYWPFNHRSLSTRTYRIVICILWTLAVFVSTIVTLLTFFISFESSLYFYTPVVLSLTIIMCVSNIGIWKNLQHQRVTSHHQNRALQRKRLTKTLLFVSMLAFLCWLPLLIMNVLKYLTKTTIPWMFYLMVNILNYSNSIVNPVVYALRIPEFQQALSKTLCSLFRSTEFQEALHLQSAMKMGQIERRNRSAALKTPEIELRIKKINPSRLQEEIEQGDIETQF
ncbi:beta-1 adrenergic receptor-like [Stylophora pistillata]|uniref:beta-1 adrenergic receptor-like n=1 Tax=Stylophora pistillata TaxID=50429 RepID=UPI000C03E6DA|nr:beta-1 adrenergic receptor-like [Stylophora pistillata]